MTIEQTDRIEIHWADGSVSNFGYGLLAYEAAYALACEVAPIVGHSGDILDGGYRTLFWATAQLAENDDGRRASGAIRRV